MSTKSIALIGATGIVGRELLRILEERSFKFSSLKLFSSHQSAGEIINVCGEDIIVEELSKAEQIDTDLAFFAAGAQVSRAFVDKVAAQGTVCIDKSSAFRMRNDVALIVAGVNDHVLAEKSYCIIASPNCVATPLSQVLAPLDRLAGLKQVIVSTYQAVSGAGKPGSDELESQVRDLFNMREVKTDVFGQRIAFNVLPFIPHQSPIDQDGKTDEEIKVIEESKKILGLAKLKMDITCVRVPVFNGHSMAVHLATEKAIGINQACKVLAKAPGLILIDDPKAAKYPTPLDACGEDMSLVGRLRPNTAVENGLSLWISSDNLRTGAALNAVRIAENLSLG